MKTKIHASVGAYAIIALIASMDLPSAHAAGTVGYKSVTDTLVSTDFSDLFTQVRPSVVVITAVSEGEGASQTVRQQAQRPGFGGSPPITQPPRTRNSVSKGSGFIIDASGIIVTNAHVVRSAKTVTVTLDDGHEYPAKVVGRDEKTDIAVLSVATGHPLQIVKLCDSDLAKVGQRVVAMGNPFNLGISITSGIISARGRNIGSGPYDDFIQTDAAINAGNSGGPLFTVDGSVLGMNTAIYSPGGGGSVGIGFSIPSNVITAVVMELRRVGHVERGFLGVLSQTLSPELASAFGVDAAGGAVVLAVEPGSPAEHIQLAAGDIIVKVNGSAISTPRDLAVAVGNLKPGESADIGFIRDGETATLTTKLGVLAGDVPAVDSVEHGIRVGLSLVDTPLDESNPKAPKGALVRAVVAGSAADKAGIEVGDVVLGVGAHGVEDADKAVEAIRLAATKGKLVLRMLRSGSAAFVVVPLTTDLASNGK